MLAVELYLWDLMCRLVPASEWFFSAHSACDFNHHVFLIILPNYFDSSRVNCDYFLSSALVYDCQFSFHRARSWVKVNLSVVSTFCCSLLQSAQRFVLLFSNVKHEHFLILFTGVSCPFIQLLFHHFEDCEELWPRGCPRNAWEGRWDHDLLHHIQSRWHLPLPFHPNWQIYSGKAMTPIEQRPKVFYRLHMVLTKQLFLFLWPGPILPWRKHLLRCQTSAHWVYCESRILRFQGRHLDMLFLVQSFWGILTLLIFLLGAIPSCWFHSQWKSIDDC